mmetsp:Transcript_9948/g.40355  ORF Transcript_9948/g.40355 Transcript_9948/m.40355 type:complete len:203 (+) Transcript_9948:441-1049(+)
MLLELMSLVPTTSGAIVRTTSSRVAICTLADAAIAERMALKVTAPSRRNTSASTRSPGTSEPLSVSMARSRRRLSLFSASSAAVLTIQAVGWILLMGSPMVSSPLSARTAAATSLAYVRASWASSARQHKMMEPNSRSTTLAPRTCSFLISFSTGRRRASVRFPSKKILNPTRTNLGSRTSPFMRSTSAHAASASCSTCSIT